MKPEKLEVGKKYKTTGPIKACVYDAVTSDCEFNDMVDLQNNTELTYVGPDADDGYIFEASDGNKYCLHDNDMTAVEKV